jgi:hypothetical protein
LQDPEKPYESASFLSNLKQRDFESRNFDVTSGPDCRLHIVGDPAKQEAILKPRTGNRADKDGMDTAAKAIIRSNMNLPGRKLKELLESHGISRGTTWIAKTMAAIKGELGHFSVKSLRTAIRARRPRKRRARRSPAQNRSVVVGRER